MGPRRVAAPRRRQPHAPPSRLPRVRLIAESYDAETAKAWRFAMNTGLDDRAPAAVLRRTVDPEDLDGLVPAARAFIRPA